MRLITGIIDAEKKRGDQRHNNHTHETLEIKAVSHVSIVFCYIVRNKEKGFEGLKKRIEFFKPTAFQKMLSPGIENLLYKLHDYNCSKKYAFFVSLRKFLSSIFDGQT